ncbi:MAG TPA: class I SAM-dependent methyltransferase [Gaiellaceae bacterium]|nr:class I SAM-dependent methyltransferase [Gaiellaceae bacterium]
MAREAPPDAFGRTAREYELGRPLWPEELLGRVVAELGLDPDSAVLDLGAGTGKLTRALVPHFARVVAVEPDDAMRAVLEEVVPGAEALAGRGEAIPLPDESVDAAFSAEAFHWFASDESVAEIARVLRPGGGFVILWNIGVDYDDLGDEAEAVIDEAFERGGEPGLPRILSGEWRSPVEAGPFEPLREAEVERELVRTRDEWIANMLSVSSIAHQPDEDRDAFARRLRELVPPEREIRHLTRTVAYWTQRV